ncbi:MAG: uroporphyrinogen decarboxylase family protein [Spirochaetota bacterium]
MTPHKNLMHMVKGCKPGWIPFTLDIGAIQGLTEPVLERFRTNTGAQNPSEYWDYDFRTFSLQAACGNPDPKAYHEGAPPGTSFDEWGIGHWAGGADATPGRMLHPLAGTQSTREVENYPEPVIQKPAITALDEFKNRGYPVFGYAGSIYEWSWWLRGMERFMADLLLHPAVAGAVVEKVCSYTARLALETARCGVDVLCFYDDAGMQTGMQISPELWRKFIKPAWKKVLEAVRKHFPEAVFFLHSCGDITPIVPDIAELGFHILHPVQPECMDLEKIKQQVGSNLVLCATISSQNTFPFGSPADIKEEVARLKALFARDKRCILCPSNAIQPETPWQNILAFVEEAQSGTCK